MLVGHDQIHERTFGRENDVGYAEYRVRSRREHFEFDVAVFDLKFDFAAVTSANPVLLHKFGLFGPVEFVYAIEQFIGVRGDFEEPLIEVLVRYLTSASFANAALRLLVGKHGVAGRTPVYGCFLAVGESFFVELKEHPLRPLVVVGHTGFDFVVPIVHCADALELSFHRGDVFQRAFLGVNTRLYGVVFGGQSECVESHRLENLVALHTLEARKSVGRSVVVPVSRMKFRPRRIGKHFETIIFFVNS